MYLQTRQQTCRHNRPEIGGTAEHPARLRWARTTSRRRLSLGIVVEQFDRPACGASFACLDASMSFPFLFLELVHVAVSHLDTRFSREIEDSLVAIELPVDDGSDPRARAKLEAVEAR